MRLRVLAWAAIVLVVSASFGGCIYPDPDDYTGSCRFTGREGSDCGKCLVGVCPAALDALCDGTTDGDFDLQYLDRCVPKNECSSTGFEGAFAKCLDDCPVCSSRQ